MARMPEVQRLEDLAANELAVGHFRHALDHESEQVVVGVRVLEARAGLEQERQMCERRDEIRRRPVCVTELRVYRLHVDVRYA
jgi:hypothetical protein